MSNWQKKFIKYFSTKKIDKGIYHNFVEHDDWCRIFKGSKCNCNPNMKIIKDEDLEKFGCNL